MDIDISECTGFRGLSDCLIVMSILAPMRTVARVLDGLFYLDAHGRGILDCCLLATAAARTNQFHPHCKCSMADSSEEWFQLPLFPETNYLPSYFRGFFSVFTISYRFINRLTRDEVLGLVSSGSDWSRNLFNCMRVVLVHRASYLGPMTSDENKTTIASFTFWWLTFLVRFRTFLPGLAIQWKFLNLRTVFLYLTESTRTGAKVQSSVYILHWRVVASIRF